jgi:peptidoglycan/xylan/chitin deacetylase (PgdA/CDA1 family)
MYSYLFVEDIISTMRTGGGIFKRSAIFNADYVQIIESCLIRILGSSVDGIAAEHLANLSPSPHHSNQHHWSFQLSLYTPTYFIHSFTMHFLIPLIPFLSAITLSQATPTGTRINTNTTTNTIGTTSLPVGAIITHCTIPGTIALTFDDGPYIYTPQILDTLAEHGARATFFLNGHNRGNIHTSPDVVQRTLAEGHQLGSHTFVDAHPLAYPLSSLLYPSPVQAPTYTNQISRWNHPSLDVLPYEEIVQQMTLLEETFMHILGFFPTYMRPPFLRHTPVVLGAMADLGYHVIGASVDTKDYENDNPDTNWVSFEKFSREVDAGGTIVLAHDSHQHTVEILVDNMLADVERRGLSRRFLFSLCFCTSMA